jgi:hypothetical protein
MSRVFSPSLLPTAAEISLKSATAACIHTCSQEVTDTSSYHPRLHNAINNNAMTAEPVGSSASANGRRPVPVPLSSDSHHLSVDPSSYYSGHAVTQALSCRLFLSILGQDIWDLWKKWHWSRFSPSTSVSPANFQSTTFSIFTNHPLINAIQSLSWRRHWT